MGISSLSAMARQGASSLASITWPTDRQIDRDQQESRFIVNERGPSEFHPLPPLSDHRDAGLIHYARRSSQGGPPRPA